MRNYTKSLAMYDRAQQATPGGAQTSSKAPGRVGPLGAFPLYEDFSEGACLHDVDGNRYVDWFNGNCAVTLGHGRIGMLSPTTALPSLPTELEIETAERLVGLIPCAEQVRFVKTGSEACAAAVRIARRATGREQIAVIPNQYNGWHDWSVARCAHHPGVPDCLADKLSFWRYNDLRSLERVLTHDPNRPVAAVMLEPALVDEPRPYFLEGVIELAHRHGALVIFDEMVCGGRWAMGGAQEHYNSIDPDNLTTPDLSTHGKAMANGYPLAFVCGPADLMQYADVISGTFGGETHALMACQEALDIYESEDAIKRIWQVGRVLTNAMKGDLLRLNLPADMVGPACRPVLKWRAPSPLVASLLQQELAERGVFCHPSGFNPSLAHTPAVLEESVVAISGALGVMAEYLAIGKTAEKYLRGELIRPAFARQGGVT